MSLVFSFAAQSDVGALRTKNDDSAYAGRNLAVLADGMGGHVGGDVASSSTVLDLIHLDQPAVEDPQNVLADEIQTANSILNELAHANPKLSGMGTTCTALLLNEGVIHLAHVGDSRAYRLKDGVFEQMTKDHSFAQRLIDEGRLSEEDAERHPHKNVLMRVLGDVDASPELDCSTHTADAGERWLLCSDGLNGVLSQATIEHAMRSQQPLDEIITELIRQTLAGGAPDNVTVVMADVVPADQVSDAHTEPNTPESSASATELLEAEPSGAILREELSARPHALVGAADLATHTGKIPIVTQRSVQKRAALMLTHREDETPVASIEHTVQRRSWLLPTFVALLAILLCVVTGLGYAWTQTQYYVGVKDGKVTIFNGVVQTIGPISLSHVDSHTDIEVSELQAYNRQRVEAGISARDLGHAQQIVRELAESITPSDKPSDEPTDLPSENPTPQDGSPSPSTSPAGGERP